MHSKNKDNKETIPAKKLKFSTMPVSLEELAIEEEEKDIVFKDDVVFHDEVLKVVVRIKDFGVKEILDYDSYVESLNTEKQLNKELDDFLNETRPRRKKNK